MSNILEQLKLARHREYVFNDGTKVGYHMPDIEECIVKTGRVPTPALDKIAASVGPELTEEAAVKIATENPEEMQWGLNYVRLLVGTMLDDINGEPLDPDDDRDAIVEALGPEKRQTLFQLGTRQIEPGAAPGEA